MSSDDAARSARVRRESKHQSDAPASHTTNTQRSGQGRVGQTLSGWRALARIAYRDPEHVAERLALYGARNLGEPSLEWAHGVREARPDVPRAVIAEELRTQTAQRRAARRRRLWDAILDRADPWIPGLPSGGGTHGAPHRCPVRPRSARP